MEGFVQGFGAEFGQETAGPTESPGVFEAKFVGAE
jgi:hypothetical protein